MKLESLNISICGYGPNQGRFVGECKFVGEYGNMEVALSPDLSDAVLKICGDSLVKNARDVAENLTREVIEHSGMPAIADQS